MPAINIWGGYMEKKRSVTFRRYSQLMNPTWIFFRLYSALNFFKIKQCGSDFRVGYPIKILGGKNIKLGKNFAALHSGFLCAHGQSSLIIGDNFAMNANVHINAASGKITIGNNVLIGPNVVIRAANHGLDRTKLIRNQPLSYGEIVIEDDVWIGSNAVICAGAFLSQGTVVGAGAVVTGITEPYSIVGGVPARKINERK